MCTPCPLLVLAAAFGLLTPLTSATAQCLDWADGFGRDAGGANRGVEAVIDGRWNGADVAIIGGGFDEIGGVRSQGLVAWDGTAWTAIDQWHDATITSLEWFDGPDGPVLCAVGSIEFVENGTIERLAWAPDQSWEPMEAEFGTGGIHDLAFFDGRLFACGNFRSINGVPTSGLAAFDGQSWEAFPDGPDGPLFAMAVFDDGSGPALAVGGDFDADPGRLSENVSRYRDGEWAPLGEGLRGGWCRALAALPVGSVSDLYAGGSFIWSGPDRVHRIGRWNGSGWNRLGGSANDGGGTSGDVESLGVLSQPFFPVLVVGGDFEGAHGGNEQFRGIVLWDGFSWAPLRGGLTISRSATSTGVETEAGSRLVVGGDISEADGKPSENIAIWGVDCTAPEFVEEPASFVAQFDEFVEMKVRMHGTRPMSFVWFRDGVEIENDDRINGQGTERLTINPWVLADGGEYTCLVSNEVGSTLSQGAVLTIPGERLPPVPVSFLTPDVIESPWGDSLELSLAPTSVADDGSIAIFAGNRRDEDYVLRMRDAELQRVMRVGDPLPGGANEEVLAGFGRPVAGADGEIYVQVSIEGPGVDATNDVAILRAAGSAIELLAREGESAPGLPRRTRLGHSLGFVLEPLETGGALFAASLRGTLFNENVDAGLWRWSPGPGLELVARSGLTAPGGDAPWVGMYGQPVHHGAGAAWLQTRIDSETGYKNLGGLDNGLWVERDGEMTPVARSGQHAPGFAPDVNFESFQRPAAVPGRFFLSSRVAGPDGFASFGLWEWSGADHHPRVLEGDPLPDGPPGGAFVWPVLLKSTRDGSLMFSSAIESDCDSGCSYRGVFMLDRGSRLRTVQLDATPPLPLMPDELTFEDFPDYQINERGMVALECLLRPFRPVRGVFGWTGERGLFPIVVPGTRIETAPGEYRVVLNASLIRRDMNAEETSTGLRDDGSLTLSVEFTDFPGGVVQTTWQAARDAYFPCRVDANGDGDVNTSDLVLFLTLWSSRDWEADFDDDGHIDTADVLAFLNAWTLGCP